MTGLRGIFMSFLCNITRHPMKIILPDRDICEFPGESLPIEDLLTRLSINPATVIVVKNGRVVLEEEIVGENEEIRIMRIAHGG
jgi:sulfur carrier protein